MTFLLRYGTDTNPISRVVVVEIIATAAIIIIAIIAILIIVVTKCLSGRRL